MILLLKKYLKRYLNLTLKEILKLKKQLTVCSIFKHRTVSDLLENYKCKNSQHDVLQDVTDGRMYKENELFKHDSNSLGILLFQE